MNPHKKLAVALLTFLSLLNAAPAFGDGEQKLKAKRKEKRFEPVVRQHIADYAGRYIGMEDYYLEIAAGADGQLIIVSQEGAQRRATLQNIRLTGARLTAMRVYQDGTTKEFEATFVNRILNGDTRFGLMVENFEVKFEDLTLNNLFYRLDSTR